MWPGLLVFAVTYVLVSARRLGWLGIDRPAGALLGAVAAVAFRVLTPGQAMAAVNGPTIVLLFGMMGMGAFLAADGFFDRSAAALWAWAKTPARLVGALVWGSGLLAALITNDAVCVLGAPLVVRLIERHRLPRLPLLLALCTATNTGSVLTLVGNPQNMLCATLGGLSYREHLVLLAPVALVGLALNHALLLFAFRGVLATSIEHAPEAPRLPVLTRRSALTFAVIGGAAVLYVLGTDLPWTATAGCALLLLLHRQSGDEVWPRIDWSVLLFFAGLFVVVEALVKSGAPALFFERFPLPRGNGTGDWLTLAALFCFGSNVVSNVPFILVVKEQMAALPSARLGWEMLAMASTFAGNLTLLGSVANIIVAEKARGVGGLGLREHLRVGLPLTLLTTLLGALWLVAVGR